MPRSGKYSAQRGPGVERNTLADYASVLREIKERIHRAWVQATRSVNRELIALYFEIGRIITERQEQLGWGRSVVEKLAHDLRLEFPGQKGFSSRNLWEMRLFYSSYARMPKLQQAVAELPWGQNLAILHGVEGDAEREYYLRVAAAENRQRTVAKPMRTDPKKLKDRTK